MALEKQGKTLREIIILPIQQNGPFVACLQSPFLSDGMKVESDDFGIEIAIEKLSG